MAPRHSAQVVMTAINLLFGRVAKKDPITNGFEWCHSVQPSLLLTENTVRGLQQMVAGCYSADRTRLRGASLLL